MNRQTVLLSAFLLFTHVAKGQTETYDILTFTPPAGYVREQGKSGVQFTRTNDAKTEICRFIIFGSRPGTSNAKQEFVNEWAELIKKTTTNHLELPDKIDEAVPEDGWAAATGSRQDPITGSTTSLVTVTGHGRVTSIMVDTNTTTFNDDIEKFLVSVKTETKIAESMSTPLSPATAVVKSASGNYSNHPIAGVWWGMGLSHTAGGTTNAAGTGYSTYGISSKLVMKRIAFFEDGTFCNILPDGGLLDYQQQRAKSPDYWGTYQAGKESGTIKLDGFTTTDEFSIQNDKIKLHDIDFEKIPRVDNYRFQGVFTAEKNPAAYQGAEPTIDFSTDGRFADHGAIYWVRHVKTYTEDKQDQMTGSGTYEIMNYTITFKYDDGRLIHMTFLETSGANPTQIRLGFSLLDRK